MLKNKKWNEFSLSFKKANKLLNFFLKKQSHISLPWVFSIFIWDQRYQEARKQISLATEARINQACSTMKTAQFENTLWLFNF